MSTYYAEKLYEDDEFPKLSHEGSCGPEAGCDALCMDAAHMAEHNRKVKMREGVMRRPYGAYGYPERGALRGPLPEQESKMNLEDLDALLKERAEKVEFLQALARIEAALNELVEIARGQDQLLNYARQQEDMALAIRDAALEIEREKQERVD